MYMMGQLLGTWENALVADEVVDMESVPGEVEEAQEGVWARRVVQYDQRKKINAEEVRHGAGTYKKNELGRGTRNLGEHRSVTESLMTDLSCVTCFVRAR